ncbi:MAG: dihydropteroate synthase [Thermoguttaceae bacterium]
MAPRSLLMAIVNVTPDSFVAASRGATFDEAVRNAEQLANDGADILDVGGESTRPFHSPVALDDELNRVVPVIRRLVATCKLPVSIDTAKHEVAAAALDSGATIINDTSCGEHDAETVNILRRHPQSNVVLMHRPHAQTEVNQTSHDNIVDVVRTSLARRAVFYLQRGIEHHRIVLDVGLGFCKSPDDNWQLVKHINDFEVITGSDSPRFRLLVGHSRKRFLTAHIPDADDNARLEATLKLSLQLVESGVAILRVHDVALHRDALAARQTSDRMLRKEVRG